MNIRASLLFLPVVALLLGGCAGDPARIVAPGKVALSSADASQAALLISEYRRARGLASVSADNGLNAAAEAQARAVAETGTLSHGSFASRMQAFKIGGVSAENLSAGSSDIAGAIERWKRSPGHNDNLLMKEARRIGLARADTPGSGYGRYWALVLAQ